MSSTQYPPHLEWEFLHSEQSIKNPELPEGVDLPGTPRLLKVTRDDQYSLKATITGTIDKDRYSTEGTHSGRFIRPFEIKGAGWDGTYELSGCFINKTQCEFANSPKFQANLDIWKILWTKENPGSHPSWLTEWYLNGYHSREIFNRHTIRLHTSEYTREREVYREPEQRFEAGRLHSNSWDYAYIQCPDFGFIVHEVPEGLGPAWSESIGIEYREEFGRIPDPLEREAVSEIVGFIMGKRLFNVGYSVYDEFGIPLELFAIKSWGDSITSLCKAAAFPPILFRVGTNKFETLLQDLVPKYLEMREPLDLDGALLRYWIGGKSPLSTDVPIIASGIEILAKAWFKSEGSKERRTYLPKKKFSALIEEELASIADKLGDNPNKERILRKIQSANNRGSGETVEDFFKKLGLNIGAAEKKAMRARNKMIHSRVTASGQEQIKDLVRLSFAYRTLFHRVMLKLLGYSGKYLDYTAEGLPLPEKEVEEAAG